MGMCHSKAPVAAARTDAEINRRMKADAENFHSRIKLLLLGAGESGKSTILKQMKILYGKGFNSEERKLMGPVVWENTLTGMKALIAACEELKFEIQCREEAKAVVALSLSTPFDASIGAMIRALWEDPAVKKAFSERNRFQLHDSAAYFFDRIDTLCEPDYIPSVQDLLQSRVRTSGIIEEEFVIESVPFSVYDVGGQKNERRKWIHCFDEVTAIIFVAAINEYDQTMFEDSSTNRLMDSLALFKQIVNLRCFANTPVVLFLNKRDLFAEKIKVKDLRQVNPDPLSSEAMPLLFDDYHGGCDYERALKYVLGKFKERCPPTTRLHYHVTCATDTDNIEKVLTAVNETVLTENLEKSGFRVS